MVFGFKTQILSFLIAVAGTASHAEIVVWEALSGQQPDQISPPFNLLDTSINAPIISSDYLTLETSFDSELLGYSMVGTQLQMPAQPVIEFNLRIDSSNSSSSLRHGTAVTVTTQPSVGNIVYFGIDEIFFLTTGGLKGPVNSAIDTDSSFHDYRLEVMGLNAGSSVVLYQDGVEILSHNLVSDTPNYGNEARIFWGNNTTLAHGTSHWRSFQHNAAAVPEPCSLAGLIAVGLLTLGRRIRQRSE